MATVRAIRERIRTLYDGDSGLPRTAPYHPLKLACLNQVFKDNERSLIADGSGMELIEVLRRRPIPIIFTTGYSASEVVTDAPVVTKPYSSEKLMAVILAVLNGNKQ